MNIILPDWLWLWMPHSSARIEICPQELDWSKVLASMDKNPCRPARPLVSVVAVKGFGGRKLFLHAAAVLIHLLSDMCSPPNVEGAGLIQSRQSYTCLVSTNFIFQLIWVICTFTVFQKYFYILAQEHFQILFEFRNQQVTFVSDVETYSSSPHIPNKSFAFY